MGVQVPLTVGRNVPLPPQVATGAPVKFALQTAVHVCSGCSPLQLGDQLVALPGTGGRVLLEHTAGGKKRVRTQSRYQPVSRQNCSRHGSKPRRADMQTGSRLKGRQAQGLGPSPKV